jgi:hypothetical protein
MTEEGCVEATHFFLKGKRDKSFTGPEATYTSVVEGKL